MIICSIMRVVAIAAYMCLINTTLGQIQGRTIPSHDMLSESIGETTFPLQEMLLQYHKDFGEFPNGENRHIVRRLLGLNPRHLIYINLDPGFLFDVRGNLLDPWLQPYRFTFHDGKVRVFSVTYVDALAAISKREVGGRPVYPLVPLITKELSSRSKSYKLAVSIHLLVQRIHYVPTQSQLLRLLVKAPDETWPYGSGSDWPFNSEDAVKQAMIDPWGSPYVVTFANNRVVVSSVHSKIECSECLSSNGPS